MINHRTQFLNPLLVLTTCAVLLSTPAAVHAQDFLISASNRQIPNLTNAGVTGNFAILPVDSYPNGLAFNDRGELFVADYNTDEISEISPDGLNVSLFATLPPNSYPRGLVLDGTGNLYVAESGTNQISKITSDGTVSLFATLPAGSGPFGLAFDGSGQLFVGNFNTNDIEKVSPDGLTVSLFATLPVNSFPSGLTFLGSNLYVAGVSTSQISRISSSGVVSLFASLPAGSQPFGLAFDANANLYVADNFTNQISKISADGLTVSTFATGIDSPRFMVFRPAPEPATWTALAAGASSMLTLRRRKRRL